jgi:spore coat protein U-like protein
MTSNDPWRGFVTADPRANGDGFAHGGGMVLARLVAALFVLLALARLANAQTCTPTAMTGNYGNVNILSGAVSDASTTFNVTCTGTKNRTVRVCIDLGPGTTNAGGLRDAQSGTNNLLHDLYSDAARSVEWGSWGQGSISAYGTAGIQSDFALGASGSLTQAFTVYGRVSASQQTSPPGTYVWTTSSPGVQYAYSAGNACPTGGNSGLAGTNASTWTATILANCLVSATNVGFGTSGFLTSTIDATGTITATCTNTTPYTVALNGGLSGATDPTLRKMALSTNSVTYGLYRDAARSQPWGSTVGTNTSAGTGTGLTQTFTVYGRVPTQTTPPPGTYSDTIIVTIAY